MQLDLHARGLSSVVTLRLNDAPTTPTSMGNAISYIFGFFTGPTRQDVAQEMEIN